MNLLMMLALAAQGDEKVKVVTTLPFLAHVAQKVGGDRVEAVALGHPKRDPHYLQADPVMQKTAGGASLFIQCGRGLDLWANDVVQHSGNPKIQGGSGRLTASKDCSALELPKVISKEWGDIHPEGNPHVWLDPLNMRTIAKNTYDALVAIDPKGKDVYEKNLKAFQREIDEAMFGKELVEEEGGEILWRKLRLGKLEEFLKEEELSDALGGWLKKAAPLKGAKMVSYHKTFVYLSERFGFEITAELEEKPGIAPPPKHLDEMLDLVKRENVKIILNDVFYSTSAADYVASKTGAKVVVVPIDVGGVDGTDTYVKLIDTILDRMIAAQK